jgi:hypothetical protein
MRKSVVSLMVMLLFVATLMSNLVYAYVLIPESGTYVSLPGSPSEPIVTEISGVKFYDSNANGKRDEGEAGMGGWTILLYKWMPDDEGNWGWVELAYINTDDGGGYIFKVSEGIYKVVELMQEGATPLEKWVQTAPSEGCHVIEAEELGGSYDAWDLGNVYLKPANGGKTMGFWGNKNGQALIDSEDVMELNNLNLYRPAGWAYPPFTDKAEIKNYLRNATAVDMRWMLSAQLIATKLNVLHGFLINSTIVYVESSGTFITIGEIMDNAYMALQGTNTDAQEYWKNLLDWVNNNWLPFVIPNPP